MLTVIPAIGSIICLLSLFAVLFPARLIAFFKCLTITTPLRILAGGVRIVLGGLLAYAAGATRFPRLMKILGFFFIIAGIVILLIGNDKLRKLHQRTMGFAPPVIRAGGIGGLLFGGFLVYAAKQD